MKFDLCVNWKITIFHMNPISFMCAKIYNDNITCLDSD